MLPIDLSHNASEWREDKVLQPKSTLWNEGMFVLPVAVPKTNACSLLVVAKLGNEVKTLVAGSKLGKLHNFRFVSQEVKFLKEAENIMEFISSVYVNAPLQEECPSLFVGPVCNPHPQASDWYLINSINV